MRACRGVSASSNHIVKSTNSRHRSPVNSPPLHVLDGLSERHPPRGNTETATKHPYPTLSDPRQLNERLFSSSHSLNSHLWCNVVEASAELFREYKVIITTVYQNASWYENS